MRSLDEFCFDFDRAFDNLERRIKKKFSITDLNLWSILAEKVNQDGYAGFSINEIIFENLI